MGNRQMKDWENFKSAKIACLKKHLPISTGEGDTREGEAWQAKGIEGLPRTICERQVQCSTSVGVAVAMLCYGRRLNSLTQTSKSNSIQLK